MSEPSDTIRVSRKATTEMFETAGLWPDLAAFVVNTLVAATPQEQPRLASAQWAIESIERVVAKFGDNPIAYAPMIDEILQYYAEDKLQEQKSGE